MEPSNGAVRTTFDIQVDGKHGPGRPKMTWRQLTERDCRQRKLSAIEPHDRDTWRSGVRSATLVGKYVAEIPSSNYYPGKYSKFCQSGKY